MGFGGYVLPLALHPQSIVGIGRGAAGARDCDGAHLRRG